MIDTEKQHEAIK